MDCSAFSLSYSDNYISQSSAFVVVLGVLPSPYHHCRHYLPIIDWNLKNNIVYFELNTCGIYDPSSGIRDMLPRSHQSLSSLLSEGIL